MSFDFTYGIFFHYYAFLFFFYCSQIYLSFNGSGFWIQKAFFTTGLYVTYRVFFFLVIFTFWSPFESLIHLGFIKMYNGSNLLFVRYLSSCYSSLIWDAPFITCPNTHVYIFGFIFWLILPNYLSAFLCQSHSFNYWDFTIYFNICQTRLPLLPFFQFCQTIPIVHFFVRIQLFPILPFNPSPHKKASLLLFILTYINALYWYINYFINIHIHW